MNGLWNQILVSRDAFLLESLAPYVDDEILERRRSSGDRPDQRSDHR